MKSTCTYQDKRKIVGRWSKVKPFRLLIYLFVYVILIGSSFRFMYQYLHLSMLTVLLIIAGIICFALFYKSIHFFDKI